ncbi:MAG TPA: peptidoglycan DD-metalloendopeptidase family protein [Gaiellaceae bacterium]|nr:peptidoglycan DD-metalloendopeptidase family protein [Gaiellaceae bacterium]
MARRAALLLALLVLCVAAPTAGGDSGQSLNDRIAAAREHEAALSAQIAHVTTQIRALERRAGGVSRRLSVLQRDLELHQARLDKLNALFAFETNRLNLFEREYAHVLTLLDRRLVEIYESPDPSTLDVVLNAKSVEDAIDQIHDLQAIALQDQHITTAVAAARDHVKVERRQTRRIRVVVAAETQAVAVRTQQARSLRDSLLASRDELASTRAGKRHALAVTRKEEQNWLAEANATAAADSGIRSQLASGESPSTPSASGLIWPVIGPVVSPFGMRWGRLHAGIDIAVPTGTPIHAAAAGIVVIAGWVTGYGNYTCINHGGGLATCYAHQESFAVSVGEHVDQGQVIGYSDCTGHCFGPHLHFEVRIDGTPVDPLGYL